MKCFRFAPQMRYALFALALSAFVPLISVAQEREDHDRINYFENDNADAMREWFSNYLNPNHDPDFWQKRMDGMQQFAAMRNPAALKANAMAAWIPVGASQSDSVVASVGNVSGRVLSFDIAPDGTFYLSPALGGMWKSNDRGHNWVPISDGQINSMCVSAIACDPHNANVIYAGTGEAWASLSVFNSGNSGIGGTGVYKSTDAGLTWNKLSSGVGTFIQKILVNPANTNVIYLAGSNTLFRSTDAGKTWASQKYTNGSGTLSALSLANGVEPFVIDPTNPSVLYAHTGGNLVKTTDAGDTWTLVATAGAFLNGLQRTNGYLSLAIAPSNPQKLYLAVASTNTHRDDVGWIGIIEYSNDGGNTWTVIDTAKSPHDFVTQGDYCVALAVSPKDENSIVFGGLNIYTSSSNGDNPQTIGASGLNSSDAGYTHADIRRLMYIGDTLFALADGGIFYNTNFGAPGAAWGKEMNNKLYTFQQLGGDVFLQGGTPKFFIAGAQDNGTTKWIDGRNIGQIIHNGDGGRCFVEQSQGKSIYATYPEFRTGIAALWRNDNGGAGFEFAQNLLTPVKDAKDVPTGYLMYDVCEKKFSNAAFCGIKYGWYTDNSFNTMKKMDTMTTAMKRLPTPTYIHISKANASTFYYGGNSTIYWSTDVTGNGNWHAPVSPTTLGNNPTWITSDPADETYTFLTTSTTSGKPLWATTDGGQHWWQPPQKLDNGQSLPTWVYRTVAVDKYDDIFIGGDGGVLAFDPADSSWVPVTNGIPAGTMVTQLQVRGKWLIATTYGRGMYYINTDQFFGRAGVHDGASSPVTAAIESIYPNPVAGGTSTIRYSLESGSITNITVFDNLGRQEKLLANEWDAKGEHEKSLDLSGLPAGTHFVLLTADGVSISKAVTIQ